MGNVTGIFSSKIIGGQVLREADIVMELLLDCKLRIHIIKLPTPIHNILGNLQLCCINLSRIKEGSPPTTKGKLLPTVNPGALKWWFESTYSKLPGF